VTGKVTSLEVAELAGVSRSAVSRVFTPGASVSEKTAAKVRRAADKLGYRPNVLARSLMTGRSRMIGLVVAYLDNHFYPGVLERLSNALQANGYHVLVFMTSQDEGNLDRIAEEILDYQVDGIILASVAMSSDISLRCQAAGVPVVLFNRSQDTDGVTSVTSNNYAGGRKIAEFLAAGGHTRFGYIAGWEGASTQRDREAGFRAALAERGHDVMARGVGNFRTEAARAATLDMFDRPADMRPDAVFVANDHMAIVAMDVIRYDLGLSVPDDVSVVGYDDVPPAAWRAYDLTTIRQRANTMVKETINALLEKIEEPNDVIARRITIDGPLIVRSSARVPAHRPQEG